LFCLILPLLLAATVSPGRAWAASDYDDLLQVTSELYVYKDWPTNSQTLDLSSIWWNDYKTVSALRVAQDVGWSTDFVSRFERIMADGGSWGVVIHEIPDEGNLISIFGTSDPDATCHFAGIQTGNAGLSCVAGSDYDTLTADYFTHNSYGGNGCNSWKAPFYMCSANGMGVYQSPRITEYGDSWFLDLESTQFFTMHFAVNYPDGYDGPPLPGARAVAADDQDHDGLLDSWETNGLDVDDDGIVDVDLPAMGAAVDKKDIFIEVDWMEKGWTSTWKVSHGDGLSFAPDLDALKDVVAAFLKKDIRLHIDAGPDSMMNPITKEVWGDRSRAGRVPYIQNLVPIDGSGDNADYNWSKFNAIKAENFDTARRRAFRYVIYGDHFGTKGGDGWNTSGVAQISEHIREGDSFALTQGGWDGGFSRRQEAGTFMHELGHTLGLQHGGGDDYGYKPNYLSVMHYSWQMYGTLDYSESVLPSLDETTLDETTGVEGDEGRAVWFCPDLDYPLVDGKAKHWIVRGAQLGSSADWNCDGSISDQPVSADVNRDNEKTTLPGYNDWKNLAFVAANVGTSNGANLDDQYSPPTVTPAEDPEPSTEELKAIGAYGDHGDGTVTVIGPSVIFSGVDNQSLQVKVTNMGESAASYVVSFSGLPGLADSVSTDTIPGYGSQVLTVPVQTDGLAPGDYAAHAFLTRPSDTQTLSDSSLALTVPDMEDPTVRAQAEEALRELSTPQPGMDESLRTAFVAAATPLLDQDGDGVLDDEDGCPDQAGTAADGCAPLMQFDGPAPVLVGDARYGSTISATLAGLPDGTDLALQWNRDGAAVPGRTGATYQIGQDDLDHEITVTVTASKTGYQTKSLTSAPLTANSMALASTPTPTVTGKARPNHRLTAKVRTWAPAPVTLSFQWLRDGAPIPGATGLKYKVQTADGGARLSIQVTGSKPGYASVSKVSKTTKMVPRTKLKTATPTIGGTPQVGSTLTAKSSKWTSGTTLTHQWFRSGKKVTDATGPSYVLTSLDQGTKITVKITGTKQGYTTVTKTSKPTRKVT
jgi:hypothetical protein